MSARVCVDGLVANTRHSQVCLPVKHRVIDLISEGVHPLFKGMGGWGSKGEVSFTRKRE